MVSKDTDGEPDIFPWNAPRAFSLWRNFPTTSQGLETGESKPKLTWACCRRNPVCIMLLQCMRLRLTVGIEEQTGEVYFSHSQQPLVIYSSLCRAEVSWTSSVHFGMSTVVLVQIRVKESCWWDFMGVAAGIPRRHSRTAWSLALTIFPFLLWSLPRVIGTGILYKCIH